ncbi:unnamed protein product, partial [Prorocentrum cordatum]
MLAFASLVMTAWVFSRERGVRPFPSLPADLGAGSRAALPGKAADAVPFGRSGLTALLLACCSPALGARPWCAWLLAASCGALLALRGGRLLSWPVAFCAGAPHALEMDAAWWLKEPRRAWRWWLLDGLPSAPRLFQQALREAPHLEPLRRAGLLAPQGAGGQAAPREQPPLDLRYGLEVWSPREQAWLRARVAKESGNWVTVRYRLSDGQEVEQELHRDNKQLRTIGRAKRLLLAALTRLCDLVLPEAGPAPGGDQGSGSTEGSWECRACGSITWNALPACQGCGAVRSAAVLFPER